MRDPVHPFYVDERDPPAKRAIMRAALELFAKQGVDGVNIRRVAEKAGFTNPALFKHFAGKEELAQALFEACYRRLQSALVMGGAENGWRGAVDHSLTLINESPESVHYVIETLFRHWPKLPPKLRAQALPTLMRTLIAADQKRGRLRADVDARMAAIVVLGALAQMARLKLFGDLATSLEEQSAALCGIIAHGIEK